MLVFLPIGYVSFLLSKPLFDEILLRLGLDNQILFFFIKALSELLSLSLQSLVQPHGKVCLVAFFKILLFKENVDNAAIINAI